MPGGGAGLAERRASQIGDESAWRLTFFSFPRFKRIDAQKLSAVFFPGHNYRGHGPPPPAGAVGAGPARDVVIPFAPPPYPPNPSMPAISLPLGQFIAHQLQGKQLLIVPTLQRGNAVLDALASVFLIGSRLQQGDTQKRSCVFFPGHNYRGHGPLPASTAAAAGAGHARDAVFAPGRSTCAAYQVNRT